MRTFIVDAFTDKPYSGNPAGVCILDEVLSDNMMIKIAREINHSETAFLLRQNNTYSLRWFTPKTEVNLCGHATLATAHILYETGLHGTDKPIEFDTKSGMLKASIVNEMIELDFPQLFVDECESNEIIEKAFDIRPTYTGKNDKRYLIEIDRVEKLMEIKPDFQLLQKSDRGGFMITARSHDQYDFYSRFFAPGVGINEDPVTGSAHCYLAPYWSKKLHKLKMLAFQASERTGIMECEIADNNRVLLRGNAVTMNEMKMGWKKN
ncbi:MAG: PhzF family phenazine biosynthesis protein [Mangrovibacterium sp.]